MAVLLDTHAFLWWCEDAKDLSRVARRSIGREECFLSLASIWEMAIKVSLGKLTLPGAFDRYVPEQMLVNGFSQLEIGFRHAARTAKLPWHHRDPFDRLLIAQSLENDLGIVSRDSVFEQYGVRRIW
ncbi:MAG: type II toxin-antitoxin system VapC family toxin [Acidobacteriota bacterium]|nr:type II toxin-antitoxin system VapC family toxin [Acidobacteriota bacterium]